MKRDVGMGCQKVHKQERIKCDGKYTKPNSYSFAQLTHYYMKHTVQCSCYPLRRMPFSNYVHMRTGSLVLRPQITVLAQN